MQVDHCVAAGRLMQPVDVLGQQKLASAQRLQPGECAMGGVRPRPAEAPPAELAARPVAPARRLLAHEGLIGHRLRALPFAVGVAIVGDAGARAATCAGQDEETSMPVDEVLQTGAFLHAARLLRQGRSRQAPFWQRTFC